MKNYIYLFTFHDFIRYSRALGHCKAESKCGHTVLQVESISSPLKSIDQL